MVHFSMSAINQYCCFGPLYLNNTKFVITHSLFELQTPDFAWNSVQTIQTNTKVQKVQKYKNSKNIKNTKIPTKK